MKRSLSILGLALISSFLGCDSSTNSTDPLQLEGSWELVRLELPDGQSHMVSDPSRFTLRFDPDGELSVQADCNSCFGSYQADGTTLDFGPLGCTRAFCGEDSLDVPYLAILSGSVSYQLSVGEPAQLTLRSDAGTGVFRAVP